MSGGDVPVQIETVAMLEAHVALVDRLNAGTAARKCRKDGSRTARQRPEAHPLHTLARVPGFGRTSKLAPTGPVGGSQSRSRIALAGFGAIWQDMFTGLVETTGTLRARDRRGPGYRLAVQSRLEGFQVGDSVAVNGACVTVTATSGGSFEADLSLETAELTNLARVGLGGAVNLERALQLGTRLGGHLVSGHVDGLARVETLAPVGEALRVSLRHPPDLAFYLAEKGSVALDGVSLTVNAVAESSFEVMLVPHTRAATNLNRIAPGREMNLEVDLLARYVVRYLTVARAARGDGQSAASGASPSADGPGEESLARALKRAGIV
jgi:riboflavin synthase